MPSLKLFFCLTCLFMGEKAKESDVTFPSSPQAGKSLAVNVGDNVTLQCSYEGDDSAWFFWYKQILGEKPKLISSFYVYDTKSAFFNEFKDNKSFKLEITKGKNNLHIFHLNVSDSATYYCASSYTFVFSLAEGIILSVRDSDSNVPALVHQSVSGSIQLGGSVTLNCTVQTGTCDGQHSVYWFKDSGEARPGVIYTHGDRNDQCERKPDTQTHTCVYDLPLQSLNASHAGTYYCAVASCGHILFGNGTELDLKYQDSHLVNALRSAFLFTSLLSVLLAFLVCKVMNKHLLAEPHTILSDASTKNSEVKLNEDNCHYVTPTQSEINRRGKKDDTWTECVYFSVKS